MQEYSKIIKLDKQSLNEVLKYISLDNFEYGLIFKLIYVYGRNVNEVLNLQFSDVDLDNNLFNFKLINRSVKFKIHDSILTDLLFFLTGHVFNDEDYIFLRDDDVSVNVMNKRLNFYLKRVIRKLNRNKLNFHCPVLVCSDLKNLRGQHLFVDGADIKTINQLYCNRNVQVTKDLIRYKELMKVRFRCNSIKKVFDDFTDLNLFSDLKVRDTGFFTVCSDNGSVIVEYDILNNVVITVFGEDYAILSGLNMDDFGSYIHSLNIGDYVFVDGLKILRN